VRWKGLIFTVRACERTAPDEPVDDHRLVSIDASRGAARRLTHPRNRPSRGWMYAAHRA
jgi:hypothetical protein